MLVAEEDTITTNAHLEDAARHLAAREYERAEMAFSEYLHSHSDNLLIWKVVAILRAKCNSPVSHIVEACDYASCVAPSIYFDVAMRLLDHGSVRQSIPLFQASARSQYNLSECLPLIRKYQALVHEWDKAA